MNRSGPWIWILLVICLVIIGSKERPVPTADDSFPSNDPSPSSEPLFLPLWVEVVSELLLRNSPSFSSEENKTLTKGEVEVLEIEGSFAKVEAVSSNAIEGWIPQWLLDPARALCG